MNGRHLPCEISISLCEEGSPHVAAKPAKALRRLSHVPRVPQPVPESADSRARVLPSGAFLPDMALVDRGSGFTEAWNTGKGERGVAWRQVLGAFEAVLEAGRQAGLAS